MSDVIVSQKGSNGDRKLQFFGWDYKGKIPEKNIIVNYLSTFDCDNPSVCWAGIVVLQYSALWLNSADRCLIYSAVWLNIRPSGFLFIQPSGFGRMDKFVPLHTMMRCLTYALPFPALLPLLVF